MCRCPHRRRHAQSRKGRPCRCCRSCQSGFGWPACGSKACTPTSAASCVPVHPCKKSLLMLALGCWQVTRSGQLEAGPLLDCCCRWQRRSCSCMCHTCTETWRRPCPAKTQVALVLAHAAAPVLWVSMCRNKGVVSHWRMTANVTGGFYGAIWKYAGIILIAAPLFAATDFVEMRLVLVRASQRVALS